MRSLLAGYSQTSTLSAAEVQAIPMLLQLRAAIPVLWWLGRSTDTFVRGIGYMQVLADWLDRHDQQFVDTVAEAVLCK